MLRAAFSADGMFPNNTIPSNMTTALNGTLQSHTIGWDHGSGAGVFVLIPVTFVTLLSIIAVVISINRARSLWANANGAGDAISFDSSDTMHLIVAISRGGLANAVGGFSKTDMENNEKLRVRLGIIDNEKMGLVTNPV